MVHAVPDILARIVETKRAELAQLASARAELERRAAVRTDFRDFRAALAGRTPAIIAEIKKASPSKGVFIDAYEPSAIAKTYASGGAAALSVLTDRDYFQGSLADLEAARLAVGVPVLRKDFTIDEIHVVEAAAHGADAILLIAAILEEKGMRRLRELAARYRMAALVEVHNAAELDAAIGSGAEIIGVNNRNLHTFEVTLETSLRLAEKIPSGVLKVAESGIHARADVVRLQQAGFQAFLVGEHLMKSGDAAAASEGVAVMMVKVCGITRREDAEAAVAAGASAIGFVFYPKSPRHVEAAQAAALGEGLDVWKVGVFVDETAASVEAVMRSAKLDVAQIYGGEFPHGRVWRAFRVKDGVTVEAGAEAVLLDGPSNGVGFDWTRARGAADKVIVAGGLDAANVAEAIRVARPWGVDASSKLESAPGIKDHDKVRKFVAAARKAGEELR